MSTNPFGTLLKKLRAKRNLTLRKFCLISGLDPGNVSRWERGITNPPQVPETLRKIAIVLGLDEGSDKYEEFMNTAFISAGRLPKRTMDDRELVNKLPVFLRTLDGRKLSSEQLDALIRKIKENHEP